MADKMTIFQRRKKLGLTQVQVARAVGVSLQAYILWEKEVNNPNSENAEKLEKVLSEGNKNNG